MVVENAPAKPKRTKTSWACNHCHRAHLTCDSARPCKRCVRKGLQNTCEDAPRKKKKYLADVPRTVISSVSPSEQSGSPIAYAMSSTKSVGGNVALNNGSSPRTAAPLHQTSSLPNFPQSNSSPYTLASRDQDNSLQQMNESLFNKITGDPVFQDPRQAIHQDSQLYRAPQETTQRQLANMPSLEGYQMNPKSSSSPFSQSQTTSKNKSQSFLSTAADMEYSTLSSILQDNFAGFNPAQSVTSNEDTPQSINKSPGISPPEYTLRKNSPSSTVTNSYGSRDLEAEPDAHKNGEHSIVGSHRKSIDELSRVPTYDPKINQYQLGSTPYQRGVQYADAIEAIEYTKRNDPKTYYSRNSRSALSFAIGCNPNEPKGDNILFKDPEEIYAKIKKPFSYTPGFHKLIAYLRSRFPRDKLVKMAESMAVYRPSFIACTNSLRESDLIFMEQCFQRTLLTYDAFIKVSGTPTIVWRRTGEIAYVDEEFSVLTGWTQQQLMGTKPTFIVELLDDESVVEYFQLFSKIAFGDFLGATMTECTLLTPRKDIKIRAGCIWTLKRDVFGIPMMIIGNFLPIA